MFWQVWRNAGLDVNDITGYRSNFKSEGGTSNMSRLTLFYATLILGLSVTGVLGVEERQACANAITNCDAYGQAACSAYEEWARQNCPAFCNFCSGGSSTSTSESCVDIIDNCAALGPNTCQDYIEFSHVNCQRTCNLCGNPVAATGTCADKLNNCAAYDSSSCTGEYTQWAQENCARTCNFCSSGGTDPTDGSLVFHSDVCFYNGHAYQEGEQWQDGCQKNCTCVDQRRGYYLCQDLCPTYSSLPANCQMVTPPGECCAKPNCPAQSGCDYSGQVHAEGQQWTEACDYICTCKDGSTGYYECRAMCIQWNLLPSCHLENPPPGKCCPVPSCPPNVQIHYPDDYIPM